MNEPQFVLHKPLEEAKEILKATLVHLMPYIDLKYSDQCARYGVPPCEEINEAISDVVDKINDAFELIDELDVESEDFAFTWTNVSEQRRNF